MASAPKKGDIIYLQFNPQTGHEQAGRRPAIVLSPQAFNDKTGFAFVCPITSQKKDYPFEVDLPKNIKTQGVILTDQLKSLDWTARDIQIVENVDEATLEKCLYLIQLIISKEV